MTEKNMTALAAAESGGLTKSQAMEMLERVHGRRLERIVKPIDLYLELGDFYTLDGGDTFILTAVGYQKVNSHAGMRWENPATVNVDGEERENPFLDRDEETGEIRRVYVARTLVGRNPTGNRVAAPAVICYDPEAYAASEYFRAVKLRTQWNEKTRRKEAATEWGGAGRLIPTAVVDAGWKPDDPLRWMVKKMSRDISVVIDIMDPEIQRVMETQIDNRKFAERKAATICERLACARHPGMPSSKLNPDWIDPASVRKTDGKWAKVISARARIPVVGWLEPDTERTSQEAPGQILDVEATTAHEAERIIDGVHDVDADDYEEPVVLAITQDARAAIESLAAMGPEGARTAKELAELRIDDPAVAADVLEECRHHAARINSEEGDR